jgi:cytochrome P450
VVEQEIEEICNAAAARGELDWDIFFTGWMRMVRRIVLGDRAADDTALTDLLERLRYRGNYAFLRRKAAAERQQLLDQLHDYVRAAPPESLAGKMAAHCSDPAQMPHHQLPQYLFAFDPGAMATFRTLAMLLVDAASRAHVQSELDGAASEATPKLPFLRACYLETLRLWPTTPAILRETTETVPWSEGQLEKATHITIFTPFLHRDDETIADAHTFNPQRWIGAIARPETGLVPFSYGPVQCPAAHFVPMVASLAMRCILGRLDLQLTEQQRLPLERLPGTLDNFTLRFSARDRNMTPSTGQ